MACTVESLKRIVDETQPPKPLTSPESLAVIKNFQATGIVGEDIKNLFLQLGKLRETSADEVYPGIYVGNVYAAQNIDFLKKHGIIAVLNCAQGTSADQINTSDDFYRDSNIKFLGLNIVDNVTSDIFGHLDGAFRFIDATIEDSGKVLIHCKMGVSRSASVAIAYLMSRKKLTAAEAVKTVKQQRDIHPNDSFLQQLCELDKKLRNC